MKKSIANRTLRIAALTGLALSAAGLAIFSAGTHVQATQGAQAVIHAVGAENEYANVLAQIGGRYIAVTGIMDNPSTDPHVYEASTTDATLIAQAQLVVENGIGYDPFIQKLESASPNMHRINLDVGSALGYPSDLMNPHLWFKVGTMPRVASIIAADLSKIQPAHAAYFRQNVKRFDASLTPWYRAIAAVKKAYHGDAVAVTEPVFDYVLQACDLKIATPWSFQASVMNGTDPSPQDAQAQRALLSHHAVKVFVYNQQTPDTTTAQLLDLAKEHHVATIGVYETMPLHHTYQSWMLDEVQNLQRALANNVSTETIS